MIPLDFMSLSVCSKHFLLYVGSTLSHGIDLVNPLVVYGIEHKVSVFQSAVEPMEEHK